MAIDVYAWTDVETSGLRTQDNHLLQVGCMLTDTQLNVIAEPREWVVRHTQASVEQAYLDADPFVKEMHVHTGLWEAVLDGVPIQQVDREMLAYIRAFSPEPRRTMMAGNSLRLDMNFVEENLPATYGHLHYRLLDVSAIAQFLGDSFKIETPRKERAHTSVSDLVESLGQLRHLRQSLVDMAAPA